MIAIDALQHHTLAGLEYAAMTAFAVSGVISALRHRMDVVGIVVCGFLAAFGGGTLRDVLIDRRPFFWVEQQLVLMGVLVICLVAATFFKQHELERHAKWLQVPDAIGLGLFCATGVHLSWGMGQPPLVALMMGVITGTFGGVLRDVVCNEIPTLFKDHRPYALCALLGGIAYVGLQAWGAPDWLPVAACAVLTSGSRLLTLWWDVILPAVDKRA